MPAGSREREQLRKGSPRRDTCATPAFPPGQPPAAPADTRNSCWGWGPVPAKLVDFSFIVLKKTLSCYVEKTHVGRRASDLTGEKTGPQMTSEDRGPERTERRIRTGAQRTEVSSHSPTGKKMMAEIHVFILFPFLQVGKLRLSSSLRGREEGKSPFVKVPQDTEVPCEPGRQCREAIGTRRQVESLLARTTLAAAVRFRKGRHRRQTCALRVSSSFWTGCGLDTSQHSVCLAGHAHLAGGRTCPRGQLLTASAWLIAHIKFLQKKMNEIYFPFTNEGHGTWRVLVTSPKAQTAPFWQKEKRSQKRTRDGGNPLS